MAHETKFNKQGFLQSEAYRTKKDLIKALLEDGKLYSTKEVDDIINKYLKKVVK